MPKKITLLFILLLLLQLWLGLPDIYSPRLSFPPLNPIAYGFLQLAFCTVALIVCFRIKSKWFAYPLSVFCALLWLSMILPSLMALKIGLSSWHTGRLIEHEQISELVQDKGVYRLYHTDCGATCPDGMVVRHEYDTPVGIKLVKSVWHQNNTPNHAELVQSSAGIEVRAEQQLLATLIPTD